jgi:cytochrome c oxidase subunit II
MRFLPKILGFVLCFAVALIAGTALAENHFIGAPIPGGLNLQESASPVKDFIEEFHDMLLVIITAISVFVLGLLVYVIVRYNRKANPVASARTHNTPLEVIWTIVPVLILAVIAVPSFKLMYYSDIVPNPDLTIKAVGHQWYWSYEYPDHGNFSFDSRAIWDGPQTKEEDAAKLIAEASSGWLVPTAKPLRLLEVDNRVVVPVNKNVRLYTTAADVLHAFAIPAFALKKDAVPGRLNETWFKATKEGVFYGQCSEICGTGHGYMPIVIEAVSEEKFNNWVAAKKASAWIWQKSYPQFAFNTQQ